MWILLVLLVSITSRAADNTALLLSSCKDWSLANRNRSLSVTSCVPGYALDTLQHARIINDPLYRYKPGSSTSALHILPWGLLCMSCKAPHHVQHVTAECRLPPVKRYYLTARHGLLPATYLHRENELQYRWVSEDTWTFSRNIQLTHDHLIHHAIELVFEGLDTVADVSFNGHLVLQTANFHRHVRHEACDSL